MGRSAPDPRSRRPEAPTVGSDSPGSLVYELVFLIITNCRCFVWHPTPPQLSEPARGFSVLDLAQTGG